jgi:hypothetical protein
MPKMSLRYHWRDKSCLPETDATLPDCEEDFEGMCDH